MKKITKEILLSTGACFSQVRDFVRAYPNGCEVCWMCFKEAQSKHNLPVGWLTRLLYPGPNGITLRYKFMKQYRRVPSHAQSYIAMAGLQFLERRLLRCKPPKLDNRRITDFNEWASSYRFG